ncbi:hypothetical protein [Actinoallomurus sp. NPDC052274]|uniref:hypothetical protein n=1 Tax=Actinoallomurus sp. NPDC052274 TaxID=3155420 RepID=UPI00341986E6
MSLVTALRGILRRAPVFRQSTPQARREAFLGAARELSSRGLDSSSLVRYGMCEEIVGPLIVGLVIGQAFGHDVSLDGVNLHQWSSALELSPLTLKSGNLTFSELRGYLERLGGGCRRLGQRASGRLACGHSHG